MSHVTSSVDPQALTLTVVAEFPVEPEEVWRVWEDPRQLERWWGPPTYPATFTRHEFGVGGQSRYHMTGPAGDTPRGWWEVTLLDAPRRIEFKNGLAGDDGEPAPGVPPSDASATFESIETGTRMTVLSRFVDVDQMERMLRRGMEEGMRLAVGQIDEVLAGATA